MVRHAWVPVAVLVAVVWGGACSTRASLVGIGGECRLATDCESGLVCVPQRDGKRICDNNLAPVQTTEDAAAPAADAAGAADGAGDATRSDAGSDARAAPDSSAPPDAGTDTGSTEDAAPPVDSATPTDAAGD